MSLPWQARVRLVSSRSLLRALASSVAKCSLPSQLAETTPHRYIWSTVDSEYLLFTRCWILRENMPPTKAQPADAWEDDWESIADVRLPLLNECA